MKKFPDDFQDLMQAQAYEHEEQTYQVGSGVARGWLAMNDIWKALCQIQSNIEHPLFSLADTVIKTASDAKSYFGINPSTRAGQANLQGLETLKAQNVFTQTQCDEFLDLSISRTYPYKNKTQNDWDVESLRQQTWPLVINYPNGLEHFVKSPGKGVKIFVSLSEAAPTDVHIDIVDLQRASDQQPFVSNGFKCGYMKIKEGQQGQYIVLNKSFTEHVKFEVTSNMNLAFTVDVKEA